MTTTAKPTGSTRLTGVFSSDPPIAAMPLNEREDSRRVFSGGSGDRDFGVHGFNRRRRLQTAFHGSA